MREKEYCKSLGQEMFFVFGNHHRRVVMHVCVPTCFCWQEWSRKVGIKQWCKLMIFVVRAKSYKMLKIYMNLVCFKFILNGKQAETIVICVYIQ